MASTRSNGTRSGRNSHLRGFAAMDPEKQREIARKGGHASHGGGGKHQLKSGW